MSDQKPPDAGNGNTGTNNGGAAGNKPNTRTFTQEELDALFSERARRGGEAAVGEVLSKAGVKSVEELFNPVHRRQKSYRRLKD